jgi:hypothetical protein
MTFRTKKLWKNKNWPNDVKVDCKAPSNLVELIDSEINLKDKLNEFEGSLEWDEWNED